MENTLRLMRMNLNERRQKESLIMDNTLWIMGSRAMSKV